MPGEKGPIAYRMIPAEKITGQKLSVFTVLLVILLNSSGCSKAHILERQYLTFGTLITVTIATKDIELASQAFSVLEQDFAYLHENWHAWKPGSLSRVNTLLPLGKPFVTGPEMISLITKAQRISRDSHYLFNPALGKLIALWGFHQDEPSKPKADIQAKIRALIHANPTLDDLQIEGVSIVCSNPEVQLDFGGFAKGYALELAAERLLELGLNHFVINAGGDLLAYGQHPQRPWRIGVKNPRETKNGITPQAIATIEPGNGEGIFTSGNYERYYFEGEKRRHHIIDPRSGKPSEGASAVTVIHEDAALADAAATALMIAGENEWLAIAKNMGVSKVLRMDHTGQLHLTQEMAERITLNLPDRRVKTYRIKFDTPAL